MTDSLLALLQLCDSNFPSGAFSHSFGFETYFSNGDIHDAATFSHALSSYLDKQLVYNDGLACKLAHQYIFENDLAKLWELDRLLFALNLPKEAREGNRRIGEQMLKLCAEIYPSSTLEHYQNKVRKKCAKGHPALVFAIVAHSLSLELEATVKSYLFLSLQSQIQNGVRGIPLGQTNGQKILVSLQSNIQQATEKMTQLSEKELGAVSPGLEIAQMKHERLTVRLFMS